MRYNKLFNLEGKVAVVTGGAGLIGSEVVRGLSEAGAVVVVADIDNKKRNCLQKNLSKLGLNVVLRYMDITNEKSVLKLMDFIDKKFQRLDIWVNSAYPKTSDWGIRFENIRIPSWKKNIDMHFNGYFICCQKAAEYMKRKRSGSIINFSSIYGIIAPDFSIYKDTNMTSPAAYSVIKGGITNFTRYLASYYARYNIRVNCISPGGVCDRQPRKFIKRYAEKTPLKRMARGSDVVGAVIYLASDASAYVTGQNLVVDGGFSSI